MNLQAKTKQSSFIATLALAGACISSQFTCQAFAKGLDNRQPAGTQPRVDEKQTPSLVYTYLFDPRKYNDLSIRAGVLHVQQEATLQIFSRDRSVAYRTLLNEYLRRIYQGYSADKTKSARETKSDSSADWRYTNPDERLAVSFQKFLKVGGNMLTGYQPIKFSDSLNSLEGRVRYDIVGNAAACGVSFKSTVAEVNYYLLGQPATMIQREYIANASEAVDQHSKLDAMNLTITQNVDSIGASGRARLGLRTGSLSLGASKTIAGKLVAHVVRETPLGNSGRTNTVLLVSLGATF